MRHRLTLLRILLWTLAPLSLGGALWRVGSWRPIIIHIPAGLHRGSLFPNSVSVRDRNIDICCGIDSFEWSPGKIRNWTGASYTVRVLSAPEPLVRGVIAPDGSALAITPSVWGDDSELPQVLNWNLEAGRFNWGLWHGKTMSYRALGGPRRDWSSNQVPSAFDSQGNLLAVAQLSLKGPIKADGIEDKRVCIFDAATGRLLVTRKTEYKEAVAAMSFSPDGKTLFVCEEGGRVLLLEPKTLQSRSVWQGPPGNPFNLKDTVSDFALAPDLSYVAMTMNALEPKKANVAYLGARLTVWSLKDFKQKGPLWRSHPGVKRMAFNSDGTLLALANDSGDVTILRVPAMTVLKKIPYHNSKSNSFVSGVTLAWTPDGNTLVTLDSSSLSLQRIR